MGVLGIIGEPGPGSILIILMLGVLLFGKRLPEIGKTIGKGFLEFKKGLDDIKEGKVEKQEPKKTLMEESVSNDAPKFESP